VRSFDVVVRPDASALLVGGHSEGRRGADRATARDGAERPIIPASALRGALRIELERLLRGVEPARAVCSANLSEPAAGGTPCPCPICRLFGSEAAATGTLRLDDAVLDDTVALPDEEPRPGVGVSRRTGTAVARHLTFVETSGIVNAAGGGVAFRAAAKLVARGAQDDEAALEEDWRNLAAACAALNGLGGGKARGLGWVQCSLDPPQLPQAGGAATAAEPPREGSTPLPPETTAVRLRFEALAPLHLGDGRQIAFLQRSLRHAPGSTVRGALAYALLEHGLARPDDEAFMALFAPGSTVTFGSARGVGDVPSATRRRCRAAEPHVFDDLVGELVRRRAASQGLALAVSRQGACLARGCDSPKLVPERRRRGAPALAVRVRTRTAVNRLTGTAMDRKLYSIEALEPRVRGQGDDGPWEPLVLEAEVRGLTAPCLPVLAALNGREVWLGGKRSRGMGRCRLGIEPAAPPDATEARESVEALATAVEEAWSAVAAAAGGSLRGCFAGAGRVPVALVLAEPWAPESGGPDLCQGPLAGDGVELLDAFLSLAEEGRFGANESAWYGAPESVLRGEATPERSAAAGSVYVYAADRAAIEARLPDWLALGRAGCGRNREIGWGRFVIRGQQEGI
jgi:CRISPR-associated protein Csx10